MLLYASLALHTGLSIYDKFELCGCERGLPVSSGRPQACGGKARTRRSSETEFETNRLAPEDPFPAAVEDSWEALLWAAKGPGKDMLSLDTSKLATGGSSAGANLAAVVCQRAADRPELGISLVAQLLSKRQQQIQHGFLRI